MAELQCLICDFRPPEDDLPQDEMLVLIGAGSSTERGRALLAHMEGHTLVDWIRAFRMADAYIEQLEAEVEQLQARPAPVQAPAGMTDISVAYARQADFAQQEAYGLLSPAEIEAKRAQAAVRARIQAHDSNETLIPRIPDAVRPEGVVGVKY